MIVAYDKEKGDRHDHRRSREKNGAIAPASSLRLIRKIRIRKPCRHEIFSCCKWTGTKRPDDRYLRSHF
jgi:hypothetical protein